MASAQPALDSDSKIPAWKWGVVWAMFLATMLNYMDRQTLGSSADYIKKDFNLNEEGYGNLEFYFGITFTFTQLFAGAMADRVNIKWLYAGALIIWSAAGFLTGLADTIFFLFACRILLGFGEAFNWVCATGIVQRIIPRASRGIANAIFHGGASVGAAITPLLAIWIVATDGTGWRHLFMAVGAAGLVWIVIWLWLLRGERALEVSHPAASNKEAAKNELPFFRIFTMRIFWIALGVGLAVNIIWHMYRVWLPRLLSVEFKMEHVDKQYALAAFFVIADLGGMFIGWVTRRIIHSGVETERTRRMVLLVTGFICLSSGYFAYLKDPFWAMAGFCMIGACAMGMFSIFYSMAQDISGPQTSRVLGVIGAMIWLVISVIHPQVGKWVDQTKDFKPVFVLFGIVPILGFIAALFWHAKHTEDAHNKTEVS